MKTAIDDPPESQKTRDLRLALEQSIEQDRLEAQMAKLIEGLGLGELRVLINLASDRYDRLLEEEEAQEKNYHGFK